MRLPKILTFREREVEEPSDNYEAPRDMEELVKKSQHADGLCNPMRICYVSVILLLAVAVPLIVFVVVESKPDPEIWTCNIKVEYRVPCLKNTAQVSEDLCVKNGCCWNESDTTCFHSLPSQYSYSVDDWNTTERALVELEKRYLNLKPRLNNSIYDNPAVNLQTRVVSTSDVILRFYLYDPTTGEPDINETTPLNLSQFTTEVYGPEYYSVQIYRKDKALLFSTSLGPIIACDDYWELALQLPKDAAVFGLGGLRLSSKPKLLYNSGQRLGANPFIMILDTDGRAHGILFNNAGPMEFLLLENSNLLSVKSRSRVMWDISVFAGPTPADVMEQYTSTDGLRPTLPPPWALGVHICRDTERHNKTLAAEDVMYFLKNAAEKELLYESDCLQEGLLYQLDFNISTSMNAVIEEFRKTGRQLLLSLPPHVESSLATRDDLFVMNGSVRLQEEYHGLNVSYPDFFNENLQEWFKPHIDNLTKDIKDILGGFVLQDNWPASNTTHNINEDMHVLEGTLSEGTLWWHASHGSVSHYQVHNEYGLRHAELVVSSLTNDTPLVLSAATYTGLGAVGGSHAHTQADVRGTWSNMKIALETALGLGLAGIPLAGGGPVCGATGEYDEELCIRWYFMSSMLPVMRISSEAPLRDPVNLQGGYSREAVKRALELRYSLLAYFYSLFHEANRTGVPVTRPMFFDFPTDKATWTIDEQFMIGPALLARPAFYKNAVSVSVYLPKENTTWYHFIGGHKVNNGTGGLAVRVTSLTNELVLLLRGGFIVPSQKANMTVDKTLAGPYKLVVGLQCAEDGSCSANGSLYRHLQDSQINVTFTANETGLAFNGSCSDLILQDVSVYGLKMTASLNTCIIVSPNDGANCTAKEENGVIEINDLQLDLCIPEGGVIEWKIDT